MCRKNTGIGIAPGGKETLIAINLAYDDGKSCQLVILDMHMLGIDGTQLARAIKDNPKLAGTRLMMLTSTFANAEKLITQETGILRYINKPIRQKDLSDVIINLLAIST